MGCGQSSVEHTKQQEWTRKEFKSGFYVGQFNSQGEFHGKGIWTGTMGDYAGVHHINLFIFALHTLLSFIKKIKLKAK